MQDTENKQTTETIDNAEALHNTPTDDAATETQAPHTEETDNTAHEPEAETANEAEPATTPATTELWGHEDYLRLSAEFENFKKRTLREKEALATFAQQELLKAFWPTFENLLRALKAAEGDNLEKIREGLAMIHKKFVADLQRQEVQLVGTEGEAFDPDCHDAIDKLPAASEEEKGTVKMVATLGFRHKGKVVKPAQVFVAE
jgi:molecular chaperone GrpE